MTALTRKAALEAAAVALGGVAVAGVVLGEHADPALSRPSAKQDADILNFALLLEYVQSAFYAEAISRAGLTGERRMPVGIGAPGAPTPRGEFVVRNRLTRFKSAFYGPVALGTSARSETLTDWPGGGYVGVHGTDRPDLIGGAVSHGCIRLRNADIVRLARELPIGTPLTIR
jgi:lipoprotein-anchoring transpeptidase ErfK/SrfK